jgi:hypothetical protein
MSSSSPSSKPRRRTRSNHAPRTLAALAILPAARLGSAGRDGYRPPVTMFADLLRSDRDRAGLSPEQVARRFGVTPAAYRALEAAERWPGGRSTTGASEDPDRQGLLLPL